MERHRVGIVIPALNESRTIGDVVANVTSYGLPIVVDDGSSDGTGDLASAAGADVVRHPVNRGYEQALNSGFARAAALGLDYVVTLDADGQHNPQQLRDFIGRLDEGNDLVIGRRQRHQRFSESLFSLAARRAWRISDPLCGMKAYRMHLYRRFGFFDSFGSVGTELAVRSVASGCKFAELPVVTRERADAPRFGRTFAANVKILRALAILLLLGLARRLAA